MIIGRFVFDGVTLRVGTEEERWCTVHVLAWNRLDLRDEEWLAKPGSHSLAT